MREFLYSLIRVIYQIHERILALNDARGLALTDKQLHFLVVGIVGMAFVLVLQPLFSWLAKHDLVIVITWIHVFTVILVLTFAIEIGQRVGGTGTMEFADIVSGVFGFLVMFLIYAVIRGAVRGVIKLFEKIRKRKYEKK